MKVLVVGASRPLGRSIIQRLRKSGHEVTGTSRQPTGMDGTVRLDLTDERALGILARGYDAAVLTPILTVSHGAVDTLREAGVGKVVLFSSNNVAIDHRSPVYEALRAAERKATGCVILRPTMIYGSVDDGNLSRLMRMASRSGLLLCPGSGQALQQPVHIDDVAGAVAAVIDRPESHGTFAVGGPDEVSMSALFRHILAAVGRPEGRVVRLPLGPALAFARLSEKAGLRSPLTTSQLRRFDEDKRARPPILPDFIPEVGLADGLGRLALQLAHAGPDG